MSYLIHFNPFHDKVGRFTFSKYHNSDGTLNERGLHRQQLKTERKDERWAKRNYDKIYRKAYKPAKKDMSKYVKKELNPIFGHQLRSGKVSRSFMNAYNQKLAELMNQNVTGITAPSGRTVNFVAKRGDLGVYMALADAGYDMSQVKSGVFDTGKIAYKKEQVNMT